MGSHKTEVKQSDTVQGVALDHWSTFRLGALCDKIGSGATPKGGSQVYVNEGVSLIRSQNVYNGVFKYDGLSHITDEAAYKLRSVTVQQDDVLLNITGDSVARCTVVPAKVLPARVNQHVAIVRVKQDVCSPQFLQAVLTEPKMQAYMIGLASSQGGSRNALTKSNIEEFEIVLPPLLVQRKIASILGAYDDLIENNRRRIALLEKMARELYRERFVRRAKGVCSFHTRSATEWFGEITIGKTPPRKEPTHFIGSVPWVSISDMGREGMFVFDTAEQLAEASVRDLHIKVVPANTLLLSFKLTVGRLSITTVDCCTNEAIAHLNVGERLLPYMYLYLQDYEYAKLGNTCAISDGINSKIVKNMPIAIPSNDLELEQFNAVVTPMFDEMLLLARKNRNLVQQRDRLLPRLMSGKIDLEKFVQGEEIDNG